MTSLAVSKNLKPIGIPFPKGVSGNPNGRPKVSQDFQVACQEALDREKCGIEKLVVIAQNDRHPKQLDAVTLLLAYAYGKPMQQVTLTGDPDAPGQQQNNYYVGVLIADPNARRALDALAARLEGFASSDGGQVVEGRMAQS